MISAILEILFFILLMFAPTYVEVAADFTGWEIKLTKMYLYRALYSVWCSRTQRIDFYVNFTRLRDWHVKGE